MKKHVADECRKALLEQMKRDDKQQRSKPKTPTYLKNIITKIDERIENLKKDNYELPGLIVARDIIRQETRL